MAEPFEDDDIEEEDGELTPELLHQIQRLQDRIDESAHSRAFAKNEIYRKRRGIEERRDWQLLRSAVDYLDLELGKEQEPAEIRH